jgi:hypothetical protein
MVPARCSRRARSLNNSQSLSTTRCAAARASRIGGQVRDAPLDVAQIVVRLIIGPPRQPLDRSRAGQRHDAEAPERIPIAAGGLRIIKSAGPAAAALVDCNALDE